MLNRIASLLHCVCWYHDPIKPECGWWLHLLNTVTLLSTGMIPVQKQNELRLRDLYHNTYTDYIGRKKSIFLKLLSNLINNSGRRLLLGYTPFIKRNDHNMYWTHKLYYVEYISRFVSQLWYLANIYTLL